MDVSKGASIALAMAATISGSKLGAVAAINGPVYSTMVSMNYKGKLLCKAKGKIKPAGLELISPKVNSTFFSSLLRHRDVQTCLV